LTNPPNPKRPRTTDGTTNCSKCKKVPWTHEHWLTCKETDPPTSYYAEYDDLLNGVLGINGLSNYLSFTGSPLKYFVPLLLNGHRFSALYDSGANFTTINQLVATKLNLQLSTDQASVRNYSTDLTKVYATNQPCTFEIGSHVIQKKVAVQQLPPYIPILLGTDIGDKVGIFPTGIPLDYPDTTKKRKNFTQPIKSSLGSFAVTDKVLELLQQSFPAEIVELLNANEAIPMGSLCNLPDSIVRIEVKDNNDPNLNRGQYPIPKRLLNEMNQIVLDWFNVGITEEAPAGTRFNQPIFPIVDKVTQQILRVVMDTRPINNL
jgi:hypothetical protein